MSEQFEVGGRKFYYERMKLRQQMKLWPVLAKDLGPVIEQIKDLQGVNLEDKETQIEVMVKLLGKAGDVLENVERYFDAVVAQTQVDMSPIVSGKQPLVSWEEQAFRHPGQVLEYVVRCLQAEFGDFLAELFAQTEPDQSETPKTEG
jgi:hypothetical protein